MKRKSILTIANVTVVLAVLGSGAISAQDKDKYSVKVPGGLAFSEFRGYEAWQTIAISQQEKVIAVILGNPAMIEAYQAGIPGNGKPFPEGAKMAKIHWTQKKAGHTPEIRRCRVL
jgi:Cytochrome P460